MKYVKRLVCSLALALASSALADTQHYDLGDDFSIVTGNPNGAWTYGSVTAEGIFVPFNSPEMTPDDNGLFVELWANDARSAIFHNQNEQDVITYGGEGVWPPNSVWFSAMTPDKLTAAQFRAPVKGKYELQTSFAKVYTTIGNEQDLHVYVNNRQIFSRKIKLGQRPVLFGQKLDLKAGDVITIAVGTAKDGEYGDVLIVDAHIVRR